MGWPLLPLLLSAAGAAVALAKPSTGEPHPATKPSGSGGTSPALGIGRAPVQMPSFPSAGNTPLRVAQREALSLVHIDQSAVVQQSLDPFSLPATLAMVRNIISWCSLATDGHAVVDVALTKSAEILASTLTTREKVRGLILGVAMPLMTSEITTDHAGGGNADWTGTTWFTADAPFPLPIAYNYMLQRGTLGTDQQQSQLAHALIWIGYYLMAPKTACVLPGCELLKNDSSMPGAHVITIATGGAHGVVAYSTLFPRPNLGLAAVPISTWRDANWNLNPTPDQRSRAVLDLYLRVTYQIRTWWDPTAPDDAHNDKCDTYTPNPCEQLTAWDQEMLGYALDANLLSGEHPPLAHLRAGNTVESVEGFSQKLLQHSSRVLLQLLQPHTYVPPKDSDIFAIIASAIATALSLVASVFTAGAASGLLAASVASIGTLITSAIGIALGLAKAAVDGSAVEAVHASIVGGLGKSLIENAALLLPKDVLDATATLKTFAETAQKDPNLAKLKALL